MFSATGFTGLSDVYTTWQENVALEVTTNSSWSCHQSWSPTLPLLRLLLRLLRPLQLLSSRWARLLRQRPFSINGSKCICVCVPFLSAWFAWTYLCWASEFPHRRQRLSSLMITKVELAGASYHNFVSRRTWFWISGSLYACGNLFPHSQYTCPGDTYFTQCSYCTFSERTQSSNDLIFPVKKKNCFFRTGTHRLVRFIAAYDQFVHQFLLIRMVQDKTSKIGDQLLSSFIVLDFCLWCSMKSLIDSGHKPDHFSGCFIVLRWIPQRVSSCWVTWLRRVWARFEEFHVDQASLYGTEFLLWYRSDFFWPLWPSNRRAWIRSVWWRSRVFAKKQILCPTRLWNRTSKLHCALFSGSMCQEAFVAFPFWCEEWV